MNGAGLVLPGKNPAQNIQEIRETHKMYPDKLTAPDKARIIKFKICREIPGKASVVDRRLALPSKADLVWNDNVVIRIFD